MLDVTHIAGSEKLVAINGRWPSFHDAEVLEFTLSRGVRADLVPPSIVARIHVFIELPNSEHTLATIRFVNTEDVHIRAFHQNVILGLHISRSEESSSGGACAFLVEFQPAFGLAASFRCSAIEVVEASRCTPDGKKHA